MDVRPLTLTHGGYPELHPADPAGVRLSPAARDVLLLAASGCDLGAEARTPTTVEVVGYLPPGVDPFRRAVPPAVLDELLGLRLVRRMPQHQLDWYEATAAGRAWVAAHVVLA